VRPRAVVLLGHPAARHFLTRYAELKVGRRKPRLPELQGQVFRASVGHAGELAAVVACHPSAAWGALREPAARSYAAAQAVLHRILDN
jgi:uracil-DNA glycosylase